MHKLEFKLTTLQPVIIPKVQGDQNFVSTKNYIPGSSLLGFFAKEYLKTKTADANFYKMFTEGNIQFLNSYMIDSEGNKYLPPPHSIQKTNSDEVFDFINELSSDIEKTSSFKEYLRINNDDEEESINQIYKKTVSTELNFHHERDYERGSSKKSVIFHYEAISPNQTFMGYLIGEKDQLLEFMKFFPEFFKLNSYHEIYIGRSKKTQYGLCKLEFLHSNKNDFLKLNPASSYLDTQIDLDEEEIILTFLSDTIFLNQYGYATTDVNEIQNQYFPNLRIEKVYIKSAREESFVSVWKCKRPSEVSISAGSSFLLKVNKNNKNFLEKILQSGLGKRNSEGFGQVILNWQNQNKYQYEKELENNKRIISKPNNSKVPEFTQMLIEKALNKQIENILKNIALDQIENVSRTPTNSMLGKLHSLLLLEGYKKGLLEYLNLLSQEKSKPAFKQVEKCRIGNRTLFDFLQDWIFIMDKVKDQLVHLRIDLANQELGLNLKLNLEKEEFQKLFYSSFISYLIKKEKK